MAQPFYDDDDDHLEVVSTLFFCVSVFSISFLFHHGNSWQTLALQFSADAKEATSGAQRET